jgi:hypothetical protein
MVDMVDTRRSNAALAQKSDGVTLIGVQPAQARAAKSEITVRSHLWAP